MNDGRIHPYMEFEASHHYPGAFSLVTGHSPQNVAALDLSLADLAVLRAKIDELLGTPPCSACRDERHEDCPRHYGGNPGQTCGCDQRRLHARITSDQVTAYRLARRR